MPITPNYQRVFDDLKAKIERGDLQPGDRLPTAAQLQEEYGVGNNAIRTAMLLLRNEGLVDGHQGKGVYVAHRTGDPPNSGG